MFFSFNNANKTSALFLFKKNLFHAFESRFYDGEEGAVAAPSAASTPADTPAPSDPLKDLGITAPQASLEEAFNNDPEWQALLEEERLENEAKAKSDKKSSSTPDDDNDPQGDDTGSGKGEASDKDPGSGEPAAEESVEDFEFADNVIEGLKGEDLKKLPKEALLALSDFYSKHSENNEQLQQAQKKLQELLADPVVKYRQDMIAKNANRFQFRDISQEERATAVKRLEEKLQLSHDEAEEAFEILKPGFSDYAKSMAEAEIYNKTLESDTQRKQDELTTKGRQVFMNLGKFNKDLAFKETDPNKFWTRTSGGKFELNESHPESARFKEKVLPVMVALSKAGMDYNHILKLSEEFGDEAVYAMAAKKLGLPAAINTAERDAKMVSSEIKKKLRPFLKGASSGDLTPQSSNVAERRSGSVVKKNGYDIAKLSEGGDYYERCLMEKPGDMAHMKLIETLAEEGAELQRKIAQRKK